MAGLASAERAVARADENSRSPKLRCVSRKPPWPSAILRFRLCKELAASSTLHDISVPKASSETMESMFSDFYVTTRFFSQVEPPPRFIRKLKEPPLNRTNIFFGESHSDWLPVRGGESDFVFDVVTGMPSRKSHLLPAAVSSLESVTASFGSKVEVWLAPR